jgi:hypothetical protein
MPGKNDRLAFLIREDVLNILSLATTKVNCMYRVINTTN